MHTMATLKNLNDVVLKKFDEYFLSLYDETRMSGAEFSSFISVKHAAKAAWMTSNMWHSMESCPHDGTSVLVALINFEHDVEFHVAEFRSNVTFIGGKFGFDRNEPFAWKHIIFGANV